VGLSISGGHCPIMMAPEDLTRVLVNLLRNAVEAMRGAGALQISLEEGPQFLALSFADNGPGIPLNVLDKVFSPGYSSHSAHHREQGLTAQPEGRAGVAGELTQKAKDPSIATTNSPSAVNSESDLSSSAASNAWPIQHRGLGLSIVRAIVTAAGGSVWASNRACKSAPSLSQAVEMQETAASGKARAAPQMHSAQETGSSCGAIIHIEFPSSSSSSSS
jgi:signal transduction histidine kinase